MYRLLSCLLLISVSPVGCDNRWALIVAGSRGYEFYRHQSSAYRVRYFLKRNGVNMSNVCIFANRPAYSSRNKANYGRLYNKPGGPDVYGGVRPDYEGNELNVKNLEYALLGGHRGGGSYLESTDQDYVFIYYAGFGGQGLVRFGEIERGENISDEVQFLYQDHFQSIIETMAERKLFKYLFIFFESNGAGSMLNWLDEKNLPNVYAIGSSTASGRSFAKYCPNLFDDYPMPGITDVCLSMRATAVFFETAERVDLKKVNLGYLFDFVKRQTLLGKTSQEITQHGDMSVRKIKAERFFGRNRKGKYKAMMLDDKILQKMYESSEAWSDFNHEEMALRFLVERLEKKEGGHHLRKIKNELNALVQYLATISTTLTSIVKDLYDNEKNVLKVLNDYTYEKTDFTCLQQTFEAFEKCMDDFHSHALLHSHVFYTMCSQKKTEDILKVLNNHCP